MRRYDGNDLIVLCDWPGCVTSVRYPYPRDRHHFTATAIVRDFGWRTTYRNRGEDRWTYLCPRHARSAARRMTGCLLAIAVLLAAILCLAVIVGTVAP